MKNIVALRVTVPINGHVQCCMQIYSQHSSPKSRITITRVARARAIWRRRQLAATEGLLGVLSCHVCFMLQVKHKKYKPTTLIKAVVFVYMTVMLN